MSASERKTPHNDLGKESSFRNSMFLICKSLCKNATNRIALIVQEAAHGGQPLLSSCVLTAGPATTGYQKEWPGQVSESDGASAVPSIYLRQRQLTDAAL